MIDWRGEQDDWDPNADPWMDPSQEDPSQSGDPSVGSGGGTPTYDPTDPNDPLYQGDPSQSTNGANIPPTYGQVPGDPFSASTGSSVLQKIIQALGGGGGGNNTTGNMANLGSVLSKAAASSQTQNNTQDALKAKIAAEMENAKLARQKFAVAAPGERLSSSAKASMMANFTPTKINWGGPGSGVRGEIPTYSGGPAGDMANLDPKTKALAQQVMLDQLLGETAGGMSGGQEDSTMPDPTQIGQTSILDKILGGGGLATSILAALNGQQQSKAATN